MIELPVHKRPYMAFLSHAHTDKDFVDKLDHWLTTVADIPIWYDSRNLNAASMVASDLPTAIAESRGIIIIVSESSVSSGWVEEEYNAAINERTLNKAFKIIPLKINEVVVPRPLATTKWIDCSNGEFGLEHAKQLLLSLYDFDQATVQPNVRDVYFSCGWRDRESELNLCIAKPYIQRRFRLVGDSKDQKGFAFGDRIKLIMESCGAMLAVLPHRGNGLTSKYILRELAVAKQLGLFTYVFAEQEVSIKQTIDAADDEFKRLISGLESVNPIVISVSEQKSLMQVLGTGAEIMEEEWRPPKKPHYVFFARDFQVCSEQAYSSAKMVVEAVSSMVCIDGDNIHELNVQQAIRERIIKSFLTIADISENNTNAIIEAGISTGARVPTHLISKGPRKKPPFMFRDEQVWFYDSEVEMIGIVHRIIRPYRRRIVNEELQIHR